MDPKDIDDVGMQFGEIKGMMPSFENLSQAHPEWAHRLFNDWFYCGLAKLELTPKPRVDKTKALRHIKTIMGSFAPKHEHKEAAVAYLLDHWFEPATWERNESRLSEIVTTSPP